MVHTVTRFCTGRANCRIEQCIEERPAGSTRLSIKHSSERACRSFEPSESRREFDGVSNPRQLAPSPSAVGCAATHAKTRAWRLFPADSAPHSLVARMDTTAPAPPLGPQAHPSRPPHPPPHALVQREFRPPGWLLE